MGRAVKKCKTSTNSFSHSQARYPRNAMLVVQDDWNAIVRKDTQEDWNGTCR